MGMVVKDWIVFIIGLVIGLGLIGIAVVMARMNEEEKK